MTVSAAGYALRRARSGWRSRPVLLLAGAMMVTVGAAGAVGLFAERVAAALEDQSGDTLGADLLLRSRSALPPALPARAQALGLRTAAFVTLPSVIFADGDDSALASVKAVSSSYPLRGRLALSATPFAAQYEAGPPPPGAVYVDAALWRALSLSAGAEVEIGASRLRVAAVLRFEPDRGGGGGFGDIAPRLMMHLDDLEAAGLGGVGARLRHHLQLAGAEAAREEMARLAAEAGVAALRPRQARQEIGAALDRAGTFLDLAVVCALVLAAAAAMIAAHAFGNSLRDEAALLRTLGAGRAFITRALLLLLLCLGVFGVLAGAALAWAAQAAIAALAGSLVGGSLPPASPWPLLRAAVLGLVLLLGFAMPAVLAVRHTSPMRIFQRGVDHHGGDRLIRGAALLGLLLLVALQAKSAVLTTVVLISAGLATAALFAFALLLLRGLDRLRRSGAAGASWRLGLANLARRRRSAAGLGAGLGLVWLALMLLAIVRTEMLSQWQASLPEGTPNVFLINVQPDEREAVRRFLTERGLERVRLWPMARGRLVALRGEAVRAGDFDDPETERWINREFNISWSAELPEDNQLLTGSWWTRADHGAAWLSADEYAVERLDLALGDTLTLRFADRDVQFTVRNTRRVAWDSFNPNFFLLTTPEALAAGGVEASWLTSFHVGGDKGALLRELVERFPAVTPIDLDVLLDQVRGIIDRVVQAVGFLLLFALAAGGLVLLAAIESSRGERETEVALLRTLGARRRFVARTLFVEYGALGLVAGLLATGIAQLAAQQLALRVFELPYSLPLWPLWLGPLAAAVSVGGLGWMALAGVTRTAPDRVLRRAGEG